ncbi:glycoside hydrolase family 2 protein [Arachidicoccus ginsenosidivorans]
MVITMIRHDKKRNILRKRVPPYFKMLLMLAVFSQLSACHLIGVHAGSDTDYLSEKVLFNTDWQFHLGSIDSIKSMTDTTTVLNKKPSESLFWRTLTLPHDWSVEGAFSQANPAGNQGGALPGGVGWYRKVFRLDSKDSTRKIGIHFDGIYRNSEVWINGHLLGQRPNGFIGFDYNMTNYLNFDGRSNVLLVRADNSRQPNARWYTGSGINRDVYLIKNGPLSINDKKSYFFATVVKDTAVATLEKVNLERNSQVAAAASLHGQIVMQADLRSLKPVEVTTEIFDDAHRLVVHEKKSLQPVQTEGVLTLSSIVPLENVRLWSPDYPNLYTLEVSVTQDGLLLDQYQQKLGIRYFHFDARNGFYLNGQRTEIKGVCLHSDFGVLGTAYQYSAMVRQLKLLKQMGCNAIRTAHNPPAPGMLDLCDSMGFLVMDEAFDMWQKKKTKYDYSKDFALWHKRDLEDQIKRDRRHPSVFLWSIGNEIREQFDTSGIRLTNELVAIVKALDSTRPVTAAMTETHAAKNNIAKAGALDILGFNYKIDQYDSLALNFPGKALIASETVSALQTRGMYKDGVINETVAKMKDSIIYMPYGPKQKFAPNINGDWTLSAYDKIAAYWGTNHENAWRAVKSRPFIAGTFVWTGIDYLGEPVPFPYPARSSYYGIIDQAGLPKDIYYFYQSEWTDKPVLHLLPHWNWQQGQLIDVWCYYNQADQVELFLNGRSLGTRKKGDGNKHPGDNEFHVNWQVPFEKGTLKVVAYKNGKEVRRELVKTAGIPSNIQVIVDSSTFRGVLGDLCYLTIQLQDKAGNPVPNQDKLLHFDVQGDAHLVGVNNGYQAELRSFKDKDYPTWKGKCVAVIRPDKTKGSFSLHITGKNLLDKTVQVHFGK